MSQEKEDAAEAQREECHRLLEAAERGLLGAARHFIREDPRSVHEKNGVGNTPLHLAAYNGHGSLAELLLRHGAQLEAKNNYGSTPLHRAAGNGHLSVAELLLRHGAQLEAKDKRSSTPLHHAAYNGHASLAELLLRQGAQLEAQNNGGSTPLHFAALNGHVSLAELLLRQGAQLEAKNDGSTPLHLAAYNGHGSLAELLLRHGARLEAKDNYGDTPLHRAAYNGHASLAELLLRHGAQLEAKDEDGATPLHLAAENGHVPLAELLLRHGAQLEAKNDNGKTPADLARENGHGDLIESAAKAAASRGVVRDRLQGLYKKWQEVGRSIFPLIRLFFVGRGRAGKTTALRCLNGEQPKRDEKSTHGMAVSARDFTNATHHVGTGGAGGSWAAESGSVFERCAAKGLQKELAKSPQEDEGEQAGGGRDIHNSQSATDLKRGRESDRDMGASRSQSAADLRAAKGVSQAATSMSQVPAKDLTDTKETLQIEAAKATEENAEAMQEKVEEKVKEKVESLGPALMHDDLVAAVDTTDDGLKIRLQCWDCPGQQEYALLNLLYFHHGIYVVVLDMSQELDDEWPHLAFWLWAICQHVRSGARGAGPPILLMGTKMGQQRIREKDLDEKLQELMARLPELEKQLQLGPKRRANAEKSKWLFPMESIPCEEEEEMWKMCAQDVRERIQEIALQMVLPREESPEGDVPDFAGSNSELYAVPWLRAYELLAELGSGFRVALPDDFEMPDGLKKDGGQIVLAGDLEVTHSRTGVAMRIPKSAVLSSDRDGVKVQCDFLQLDVVRSLLGGIQPQGVVGQDVPGLLQLLNSLGIVVWFQEEGLQEVVMLNPGVIAVALGEIMTACFGSGNFSHGADFNTDLEARLAHVAPDELLRFRTSGVASQALLDTLWGRFAEEQRKLLREVMLRRKLLVRRAVKQEFLVTLCLPVSHLSDSEQKDGDAVVFADLGGVLSPNLFPLLAQKLYATPHESLALKPGPPQVFRNSLEAQAGGFRAHVSLFPLISTTGRWFVRVHVEARPGSERADPKAAKIKQLVLKLMGFSKDFGMEKSETLSTGILSLKQDCHSSRSLCKLSQLLQERRRWDMSSKLQTVVERMSLLDDVRPAGSFRFRSVAFPGDVDLYEYLVFEVNSEEEALLELCTRLYSLAEKLLNERQDADAFFSGMKAGYGPKQKGLLWQLREIKEGSKEVENVNGDHACKSLMDALREGHPTGTAKLDMFARIPLFEGSTPRLVEVTNVLRLGYLPTGTTVDSIQPITKEVDQLRAFEDGLKTYCGPHPKAIKFLKRLWERSAFLAHRGFDLDWNVNILESIYPVLQHWSAKLSSIADHIEALDSMLSKESGKMQRAALQDIDSLRQSIDELRHELQLLEDEGKEDGTTLEMEEAREGLRAIKEAEADLYLKLPEKIEGPRELGEARSSLQSARGMLTACVETVMINKVNLFPPLASPKDWSLPGIHLPVGARMKCSSLSSDITVAWWAVHDDKSLTSDEDAILKLVEGKDITCIRLAPREVQKLREGLPEVFAVESFDDTQSAEILGERGSREVIIYNSQKFSIVQCQRHVGESAYKRSNPRRAIAEAVFKLQEVSFRVVFTQLPDEPFGPARREFARAMARIATNDLDTILLGDLSFPEEAVCPLLLNCGLEKVNFLEVPYPTTICQGSFLPKRTDSIAVIPAKKGQEAGAEVTGEALKADEVMEGLQAVADGLNSRSARAPTPVRFMPDKE